MTNEEVDFRIEKAINSRRLSELQGLGDWCLVASLGILWVCVMVFAVGLTLKFVQWCLS